MTPVGAYATVLFHDDDEPTEGLYFHFGDMPEEDSDDNDRIFFYADGEHEMKTMMQAGSVDFVVLSYDLEY
jgi:hypothetical protein